MMKKVLVLLAILAMVGIANADLLTNGDFELGADRPAPELPGNGLDAVGWSTWNSSGGWNNREMTGNPVPDNYLIAIGAAGGYGAGAFQDVAVADDQSWYELSADASLDAWWKNAGYLKIEFYNSTGTAPEDMIGFVESDHFQQPDYDAGLPWANYSLAGQAPAGTATVRAILGTWGEGGTARFDNASLEVVPEPATMALLGLGGLLLRRKK